MKCSADFCTKDERNAKELPPRAAETDKREKARKEGRNEKDRTGKRAGIAWPGEVAALLCGITVSIQLSVL